MIGPGWVVDHDYDEVMQAAAAQVRQRNAGALVLEGKPVGTVRKRSDIDSSLFSVNC